MHVRPVLPAVVLAVLLTGLLTGRPGAAAAQADPGTADPAPARGGAVTIGQAGGSLAVCSTPSVPAAVLLGTQGATGASYVAPSDGVLTRFTHVANGKAGQVRAIVLAAGSAADRKLVVARSPKQSVTVLASNTFPVRLPIRAGERLGLGYTVTDMACAEVGVAGDVLNGSAPFDPDADSELVYTSSNSTFRPNISAVLEPDADHDGYGDVSQDACPQSAQTQVACPAPETTRTNQPATVRANPRIKLTFTSSIAGSTFECRVDRHRYKPCTSPFKKKLRLGEHKVLVRAVSPVGVPDPKPVRVKFHIVRAA